MIMPNQSPCAQPTANALIIFFAYFVCVIYGLCVMDLIQINKYILVLLK